MIYLDNAATSLPKPPGVTEAVVRALESFGNPSRGAHEPALAAARCVESTRTRLSEFFGCGSGRRVAFTANATEALNLAIGSIRGHIVTTASEHNSVLRPVYKSGRFSIVDVDSQGAYEPDDLKKALRPDTEAVILGHASNLTGQIHPIAEIGRLCRERGLIFIVDAAQTAGLIEVDLAEMNIDALCFTGHKSLYGPQGTGGLCLSERFLPDPLIVGGSGSHSFDPLHPAAMPTRLEAGTLNGPGLAGLAAGLKHIQDNGRQNLMDRADEAARHFYQRLNEELDGLVFYGRYGPEQRMPMVAFNVGDFSSDEVAAALAEEHGIAVRAGTHCAPLLHKALGTAERGAIRASFSHFNTMEEAEAAAAAVRAVSGR